MAKSDSKEFASGEDQGSGSEAEGNKVTSEVGQKRKRDEMCTSNETTGEKKNKFLKKFTIKDEKKVLRALLKHGFKIGSREFYRKASLKLSFAANADQVYEKVKGLKKAYLRRMATNNVKGLSIENGKIHDLSHRIWGVEEEDVTSNKVDKEFKQKGDDFHKLVSMYKEDDLNTECHVLKAFEMAPIPALKKARMVKKWKKLELEQSQLLQKKKDLIFKLLKP